MPKPFGPDHPGNMNGRPKGARCWFTKARDQLRDVVPEAIAQVKEGVRVGDMDAIKLLFSVVLPHQKASYPPIAIDIETQSPRDVLAAVKRAVSEGSISTDHANSILDLLAKVKRLETGALLAEREVIDSTVLDTAQTPATTAASTGDVDTLETALARAFLFTTPRPEMPPPAPTGIVSAEPIDLDGNPWDDWEKEYCSPKNDEA